jgi:hypothetical protein
MILNSPMNLGVSLPYSLKCHKPLIGDPLRYTKSPTSKLNSLLIALFVLIVQSAGSLLPYELVSASYNMSGPKIFRSPVSLQNNGVRHSAIFNVS